MYQTKEVKVKPNDSESKLSLFTSLPRQQNYPLILRSGLSPKMLLSLSPMALMGTHSLTHHKSCLYNTNQGLQGGRGRSWGERIKLGFHSWICLSKSQVQRFWPPFLPECWHAMLWIWVRRQEWNLIKSNPKWEQNWILWKSNPG